jgi:hypothetical protein
MQCRTDSQESITQILFNGEACKAREKIQSCRRSNGKLVEGE